MRVGHRRVGGRRVEVSRHVDGAAHPHHLADALGQLGPIRKDVGERRERGGEQDRERLARRDRLFQQPDEQIVARWRRRRDGGSIGLQNRGGG